MFIVISIKRACGAEDRALVTSTGRGQAGGGSGAHEKMKWSERFTEPGEWLISEARGVKYLRFFR